MNGRRRRWPEPAGGWAIRARACSSAPYRCPSSLSTSAKRRSRRPLAAAGYACSTIALLRQPEADGILARRAGAVERGEAGPHHDSVLPEEPFCTGADPDSDDAFAAGG